MKVHNYVLALGCIACTGNAAAQQRTPSMPAVRAEVVLSVMDCRQRALPTQREVGAWTAQHNFSQVYATRQRLMTEIGRRCREPGTAQVQIVSTTQAQQMLAVQIGRGN